jgi:hypothetical protein
LKFVDSLGFDARLIIELDRLRIGRSVGGKLMTSARNI